MLFLRLGNSQEFSSRSAESTPTFPPFLIAEWDNHFIVSGRQLSSLTGFFFLKKWRNALCFDWFKQPLAACYPNRLYKTILLAVLCRQWASRGDYDAPLLSIVGVIWAGIRLLVPLAGAGGHVLACQGYARSCVTKLKRCKRRWTDWTVLGKVIYGLFTEVLQRWEWAKPLKL